MRSATAIAYRRSPVQTDHKVLPASGYREWVGSRSLVALSTNAGAPPLPFQQWHRFKEAFSPELVAMAVEGSHRTVDRLCDPFGGSGTSGLAAQFMGIESVSIEVNPFLADLIEAKVADYDVRDLLGALPRVARRARRIDIRSPKSVEGFQALPPTFVEPGRNDRWLFDSAVAIEIAKLRRAIGNESDDAIGRLFHVLLGGILIEFSNAVVSGKGRRYRRGWESRRADPSQVLPRFCEVASRAIVEIDALGQRARTVATVVRGDSRAMVREVGLVDLVVCSPPYPNSFDYTDVYNVELWMLGYLTSSDENLRLRRSTLSSHVQIRRAFGVPPKSPLLGRAIGKLQRIRADLWDENLVDMVGGYFADLHSILAGCAKILRPRGQVWLVVGDSQYAGIQIRVADILEEIAPSVGLKPVRAEPFRSMRLSPQQGGNHKLAETLLVLTKT